MPIGPDFGRVIGWSIEVSTAEIQAERRADDRHFDCEEFVVEIDELWNHVSVDFFDLQFAQPEVNVDFAVVGDFAIVEFDSNSLGPGWIIKYEYSTLGTGPEARLGNQFPIVLKVFNTTLDFIRNGHDQAQWNIFGGRQAPFLCR